MVMVAVWLVCATKLKESVSPAGVRLSMRVSEGPSSIVNCWHICPSPNVVVVVELLVVMVMGDVGAVLVLVVAVIVVVVVGRARHPVALQESQQLEKRPTQPPLARHAAAFFL